MEVILVMNKQNIEMIQGQEIKVLQLNLSVERDTTKLSLKFLFENDVWSIVFYNISHLKIREFSMPFQIFGFEIVDNTDRGWENASRYTIRDFEDEEIEFFCESFDIE